MGVNRSGGSGSPDGGVGWGRGQVRGRGWGGFPWSGAEGEGGGVWVVDFGLGRSRG